MLSSRFLLAVLLVCGAWRSPASAQPAHRQVPPAPELFVASDALRTTAPAPAPATRGVLRRGLVRPRAGLLRDHEGASPERLTLNLFADKRVVAARTRVVAIDDESTYWTGRIEGSADGVASFVQHGEWLAGHVHADGRTFVIQSQADGAHTLDEVDETDQPRCGGGLIPMADGAGAGTSPRRAPGQWAPQAGAPDAAANGTGPTIELLVVYTPAARAAAGGEMGLRNNINLAVAQLNTTLANSQVAGTARLLAAREVAYTESGSMSRDLDRLTATSDGFVDEVHALRDQVGADLVVLVTDRADEGWAGYAWLMTDINAPFAPFGFSVVLRSALWTYTLAHEVGHNLGLAHDLPNSASPGVFFDSYGYRVPPHFRDIMSYACAGSPCPQIAHVSNPDVFYQGRPTGLTGQANAARALRQTLPVTALHREPPAPTLTSLSPAGGPTLGGTRVTLAGLGLSAVVRVTFGADEATGLMILPDGSLSVLTPSHPQGVVNVRVENSEGQTSTLAPGYEFLASTNDTDGDALPDDWETAMGLTSSASGVNGAAGDPDLDGISNLDEWRRSGHPRGFHRWYFAEGAASSFFETRFARLNHGNTPASTLVRREFADGSADATWDADPMPARSRRTTTFAAAIGGGEFATVIESDAPIVVDRTMTWDAATGYGSHAERGIAAPSLTWYLAEGATHSGFELFYLIQNPAAADAQIEVTYLLPAPQTPIVRTYLVERNSRFNIWVNLEGQALAAAEVSAVVRSTNAVPVIVERAMYLSNQGRQFNAGHASAGITAPATEWFLAEGATGADFDLFVLIANPNDVDAEVTVTYLLVGGMTYSRTLVAKANSRSNIWVDVEEIPGVVGFPLEDVAVSTTVTSTNDVPIIVERAMWWPGSSATWQEAHNSPGSTTTGTDWALAEGEVGGARAVDTYILIANTSAFDGEAEVTLYFEDGSAPVTATVDLPARSRSNVWAQSLTGLAPQGRRFGVVVRSVGASPAQIVVERAMYSNAAGVRWAAGSNALGTRLQ